MICIKQEMRVEEVDADLMGQRFESETVIEVLLFGVGIEVGSEPKS